MASKLLVAVDDTPATQRVLAYIVPFAIRLEGLQLQLVTIATGIPAGSQELAAVRGLAPAPELHGDEDHRPKLEALRQLLDQASSTLQSAGVPVEKISATVLPDQGGVAADLLEAAREFNCDTLVVGRRHTAGLRHFLLGSTSEQLVEVAEDLTLWVVA